MVERKTDKIISEKEIIKRSTKTLPELVEMELMDFCGFNEYETSFPLPREYGIGDILVSEPWASNGNKNIVLIAQRSEEDNYKSIAYYFGIFEGKPMSERNSEESEQYMQEIWKVLNKEHEISSKDVRNCLISTLGEESQNMFRKTKRLRLYHS